MKKQQVTDFMREVRDVDMEGSPIRGLIVTDEQYTRLFLEIPPGERFVEASLAELGIDNFCIQAQPIVRWSDLLRVLKEH